MKRMLILVNVNWFFLSPRLAVKKAGYEVHLAAALSAWPHDVEKHGLRVHPLNTVRNIASNESCFEVDSTCLN